LLVRRLPAMVLLGAALGALAGVIGLYLSYYLGLASGATITVTASALFLLAWLLAPGDGLLTKAWLRETTRRRAIAGTEPGTGCPADTAPGRRRRGRPVLEQLLASLLEPFQYPFMRNGLLEVALLGVAAGAVGALVFLRGLTFFAHALSHTVFPGLVIGV